MERLYAEWAQHEHSTSQRAALLASLGPLFLLAIPLLLVKASAFLDRQLRLPRFSLSGTHKLVGVTLGAGGMGLGLWSNYAQFNMGRGTPLPLMPTRRLVVQPPYTYCRNPMTLGATLAYLGVAVWKGSLSAVAMVLLGFGLLLTYNRRIEEKELAVRFGTEYLDYKQRTPFLIPQIGRSRS